MAALPGPEHAVALLERLAMTSQPIITTASSGGRLRHQPTVADRLLHLLRLLAVPHSVRELNRRIQPLARVLDRLVALV